MSLIMYRRRFQKHWKIYLYVATAATAVSAAFLHYSKSASTKNSVLLKTLGDVETYLKQYEMNGVAVDGMAYYFNSFAASAINEDNFSVNKASNIFCLMDGHSRADCAKWLQLYLPSILDQSIANALSALSSERMHPLLTASKVDVTDASSEAPGALVAASSADTTEVKTVANASNGTIITLWANGISKGFQSADEAYYAFCAPNGSMDLQTLSVDALVSGASVCSIVFAPFGMLFANLGETAAVCAIKDAKSSQLRPLLTTQLHNLYNRTEFERIKRMHPTQNAVTIRSSKGLLLGKLKTTRSIGDYHFKDLQLNKYLDDSHPLKLHVNPDTPTYLSNTPDFYFLPYLKEIEFIVVGSSGFWERIGAEEAVSAAANYLRELDETNESGILDISRATDGANVATHLLKRALLNCESFKPSTEFPINAQLLYNSGLKHFDKPSDNSILQEALLGNKRSERIVLKKVINNHLSRSAIATPSQAASEAIRNDVSVAVIVLPKK